MPGGICPRCGRPVYQAEEKLAFGRVWHSFCFSCNMCRKLLDIPDAVVYENEVYCHLCTVRLNSDFLSNANVSKKEFDVENQCQATACKVTFAENADVLCPRVSNSTRSLHSDSRQISTKSLRATPSPTGITTYYNRQHPSSHSDVGGRTRTENSYNQKSFEYLASRQSNVIQFPYEDNLVKTQDGHFAVSLQRVPSYSSHSKTQQEAVIKTKEEKDLQALPGFNHERLAYDEDSKQTLLFARRTEPEKAEFRRSDNVPAGRHMSHCSCVKEDLSSSSGSRSGYNCASEFCPAKFDGTKIWYGGGIECRRCGRKVYHAEMVLASGAAFHNICFSCNACRKPLDTMTVYENQGEIYCKQCYVKMFGPTGYGYGLGAGVLQTPF